MLDSLLSLILDDAWMGPDAPRRVQRVVRAVFGLLGVLGSAAGLVAFALKDDVPNAAMRLGMMGVFLAVGWFSVQTVWRRRSPKAAGWLLLGSFVVMFGGAVARQG